MTTHTHTDASGLVTVNTYANVTTMLAVNGTHQVAQNLTYSWNVTHTTTSKYAVTPSASFELEGKAYKYTTGLNIVGQYQPLLIPNPLHANSNATLTGILTQDMLLGNTVFRDLALWRPPAGTYTLLFTAADPSIAPVSAELQVTLGLATQLGVLAPCRAGQPFQNGVCSQQVFGSAQRTSLNAIQVSLLDGAANPVLGQDFRCLNLKNEIPGERNNPCRRTVTVTVVAGSATLQGAQSLVMVGGRVTFGNLAMVEPSTGSNSLLFSTPGMLPVRFDVEVIPGTGYSLKVQEQELVPAPATSKNDFQSAVETALSSVAYPIVVQVLDGGRNPVRVASGSEYLVFISCDTAELLIDGVPGKNETVTSNGVARFYDVRLLSPSAGKHILRFESLPATFAVDYEITVVVGPPVALAVTKFDAGNCLNEFGQPGICKYRAEPLTALGELEVSVRDAGGNDVGAKNSAARRIVALIEGVGGYAELVHVDTDPEIGPGEHTEEQTIMLPKTGAASFNDLVLRNPPIGTYTITLISSGMTSTTIQFEVQVGHAFTLSVPDEWINLAGQPIFVRKEYESERTLLLESIPVIVLDGGFNFVGDLDINDEGQNYFRTVDVTSDKGELKAGTKKTSAGQVFYGDVRLIAPRAGTYRITFSAPDLEPAVLTIVVEVGYPSQLAVMGLENNGVFQTEYESSAVVYLNEVQIQLLDAGGSWVRGMWDEARNVTVRLESTLNLDHGGEVFTEGYSDNTTLLIAPQDGNLRVDGGRVAWCSPHLTPMPAHCQGGAYPLEFNLPFHGQYTLVFSSDCPTSDCPGRVGSARYPALDEARVTINIVPGTPVRLVFVAAPPSVAEHDYVLRPAPAMEALDVAGNLCVQRNTFLIASFQPRMSELFGSVTSMVAGQGAFEDLKFVGVRGQSYTIRFAAPGLDLVVEFFPFSVMSCDFVKPNSRPDGRGGCECVPGYTEDVYITGYASDRLNLPSTASFPDMYRQVVHNDGDWLDILQPYGVCVPCRNGFFKEEGGAHNCTACPAHMDTSWDDGAPVRERTSWSGEVLDGSLAQYNRSKCHCIVQQEPPFQTYFRNSTQAFECEPCPAGGVCDGRDHTLIAAAPGYWRTSRQSLEFWRCPNPESCLGGVESHCSAYNGSGAAGVLCEMCASGWAPPTVNGRFPPTCTECLPRFVAALVVLLQWAASAAVLYVLSRVCFRRNSESIMLFKTLVNYMQMVSIAKEIDLNWPDGVAVYFSLTEKLSTVDIRSSEAECAFNMNHYNYTGYYMALPVVMYTAALGYAVVTFLLKRKQSVEEAYRLKHQAQEKAAAKRRRG
eukprot:CAMPEP_0182865702 /NCGR_PEP_ID=MMETSP0034_2-20130328/7826_1 /TAXON_ID=156128 /ORGANISM="Nephroselmis pyriformis, Strain CCMP717" /LENGTH=1312 /DNA_ID=CAMNT_0024998013 /DNA_START=16 /DNA_END=3950 /DNA_ORIENTATION=-